MICELNLLNIGINRRCMLWGAAQDPQKFREAEDSSQKSRRGHCCNRYRRNGRKRRG